MTGVTHNPVIQRNSLWGNKVLYSDIPEPDSDWQESTQSCRLAFTDIPPARLTIDQYKKELIAFVLARE